MFDGNEPEELIYTIHHFEVAAKYMNMPEGQKAEEFVQLLGAGPHHQWDAVEAEYNATHEDGYPRNQFGWLLRRNHFIAKYIEDPDAKGTMMGAISAGAWKKPHSKTIPRHRDHFVWLMYCYNYLPGTGGRISEDNIKKILFQIVPGWMAEEIRNEWKST